jgi:hypothetical protein
MDVLFAVQSHPKPPFNSEEASHLQFDHDTRGSNERLRCMSARAFNKIAHIAADTTCSITKTC